MFKLNTTAAIAADQKSGQINESGKYVGKFTRAEWQTNQKTGSTGIGWTFKANSGAQATIYTNIGYVKNGKNESNEGGMKVLNAIMACMRLREVQDPVNTQVEKWDSDQGALVKVTVPCFQSLMNKPIGLLFQMEIEKNSEKGTPRPTIYGVFEAQTEKTASEVLAGDKCQAPELLAKMEAVVLAKPVIDRRRNTPVQHSAPSTNGGEVFDEFEDDIPF